jgi:uncharacterized protein (TIGR00369 family)
MLNEDHYRKLENMMKSAPIVKLVGAQAHINQGHAQIVLPIRTELFHAASALHGAMYFLTLDNAAFFAANSLVDDVLVLTMTFNINFFRPVTGGVIRGTGTVVNNTGKHFFVESVLYNSEDQEIARGTGIFVKSQIKLTANIGYQ